ncbi:aspartyl protease family protein [Sphingomonas sp. A2-49]|uniref:retroviral-like aspartic protease family protein n=1 Tax=Sphingomonas sp. A2-49 TaxID=1391375 RepID=UPI0021D0F5D5|nr:retroviral-like aspartic protease family protein [Sphingomonas sp. A2-49]MCU6455365.1 aspartyl protease family protein [Sphingomonas sp. A2-49]
MAAFDALCLARMLATSLAMPAPQQAPPPPASAPAIRLGEATIDDTLEIAGDAVAGQQLDTRMAVRVQVNGRGPYRFVVDSGADRTVIGEGLAAALRLPAGLPVTLHGMAGASRRETARIDTITIGGTRVDDLAAPVLPETYLGARGLLGIDALRGQRLMLDFERQTITIEDARRPVRANADEIVVTARRRGGQLILTQARAGGVGIRAVVDTGSQLTIGNLALRDALFRRRTPPATTPVTLVSVTGETLVLPYAIVPEMRIGGIVMRDVPVAFADLPPFALFGLADAPAMMLGTDLMGAFRRVSLDFGAKKVRFQLRRCQATLDGGWRTLHLRDERAGCPPGRGDRVRNPSIPTP